MCTRGISGHDQMRENCLPFSKRLLNDCSFPILSSLLLNDILCVKVYLNVAMLCMCLGKGNVGEVVVSFIA